MNGIYITPNDIVSAIESNSSNGSVSTSAMGITPTSSIESVNRQMSID